MTTATFFSVFEDFNDQDIAVLAGPEQADPAPAAGVGDLREKAWTDGYMTGRQERVSQDSDPPLAAKMLTLLHELEGKTSEAVDEAALAVADLMVSTVITLTSASWSATLMDRVRTVADRIKPALTVAPEFILRDDRNAMHHFAGISDLSRALEDTTGEDVTIRWQRGEATISRKTLLEDLQEAMIPLSAGLVGRQNARQQA